jgi:hypothetical protein
LPAVALAGMITARIRGAAYRDWLMRAREVASVNGDKLVYLGEADGDDLTYSSHLIELIQRARIALHPRADAVAATAVMTALNSLAEGRHRVRRQPR